MSKRKFIFILPVLGVLTIIAFYYFHTPKSKTVPTPVAAVLPERDEQAASTLLQEIHRKEQNTGFRIMLIGWDAADWQVIDPLMQAGKLPNLKRLIGSGASAYLRSYKPMLSPLLWNSIATGKYPTEHGVLDFLVIDEKTKKPVPMDSTFRKTMALWNMLTEAGRTNAFVAWWATWPAESLNGVMVTDRVSYSLFSSVAQKTPTSRLTWPEQYYNDIKPKLISDRDITDQELAAFINISPSQITQERTKAYPEGKTNPVAYLAQILASTKNYKVISLDLLAKQKFDVFSCYFEGTDQVGHLFQHCMPPKMEMVTEEEYRRYKDVVPRYYEYLDRITGELLRHASSDTVVMLMSDHGFKNGGGRPTDFPPYISERPAYWHREYGVFVASGGPIRKGIRIDTVTIFDVVPSILHLLGLPVGKDLPGTVLAAAFNEDFAQRFPVQSIPSWEPLKVRSGTQRVSSNVDEEVLESLAALGYIGEAETAGKGGTKETAAFHRNLATIYLNDKKLDLAEKELEISLTMGEILETYELLFEVKKAQGKTMEAAAVLEKGMDRFPKISGEAFLKLIDLYTSMGQAQKAQTVLQKYGSKIPSEKYRLYGSALIKEASNDPVGAENEYLAALDLDPTFAFAMERLYKMYKQRGNLEKLEDLAKAGLRMNDQLAIYHNVLGVVNKKRGKLKEAVRDYKKALDLDPDNSTYWANLAAAYLNMQRPQDALEALLRAKNKNDRDPEVWINLGAVYGTLGQDEEGLAAFRKAKELGAESPNIELGIAAIHAQKGDVSEALRTLQNALTKYPNNPDLKDLLAVLEEQS